MPAKILVTQKVPEKAIDILREVGEVEVNPDEEHVFTRQELLDAVKRNDYIFCLLTNTIDAEVMDANPNVKIFANYAVGYNNIDVAEATKRKIVVSNTPGVLTDTTADFAWTLLMAVARRVVEGDSYMRAGRYKAWGPLLLLGTDVHGKTLGIVGFGRIGQAMAKRASGFDMRVVYYDVHRQPPEREKELKAEYMSFEDVLRTSDFVTTHVDLNQQTRHLFDDRAFGLMKQGSYFINAARGPVHDEKALVRALQSGHLGGAGLDVFEEEPKCEPELLTMSNVVLAPHIASATVETRTKMATLAASNIVALIKGARPPTAVNPEVLG